VSQQVARDFLVLIRPAASPAPSSVVEGARLGAAALRGPGSRLARLRRGLALSQQQAGALMGLSQPEWSLIERVPREKRLPVARRALWGVLQARRRWRGDARWPLVWDAVRAFLALGEAWLAEDLLFARPERLRDVLRVVLAHVHHEHPPTFDDQLHSAANDRLHEALNSLEESVGRFRGADEDWLFAMFEVPHAEVPEVDEAWLVRPPALSVA